MAKKNNDSWGDGRVVNISWGHELLGDSVDCGHRRLSENIYSSLNPEEKKCKGLQRPSRINFCQSSHILPKYCPSSAPRTPKSCASIVKYCQSSGQEASKYCPISAQVLPNPGKTSSWQNVSGGPDKTSKACLTKCLDEKTSKAVPTKPLHDKTSADRDHNDILGFSLTVHQEELPAALGCHWEDCLLSPVPGSRNY